MRGKGAVAVVPARPFSPKGGLIAQGAERRRACAPGNNCDGSAAPCVIMGRERKAPSAAWPALQETGAAPCVFREDVRQLRQYAAARSRLLEDVAGERKQLRNFHFSLNPRLPQRRCETHVFAHVFHTSSLKTR